MGIIREYIKCEVCGAVTRVRTQFGYLDQHPIRVSCGQCGILIIGTAFLNQKHADFHTTYDNAQHIYPDTHKADFYIEASGELLTKKLRKSDPTNNEPFVSPFFETLRSMSKPTEESDPHATFAQFQGSVLGFLHNIDTMWPYVRRVNELWINRQSEYLRNEVQRFFKPRHFPMNNDLEQLRGVHGITRLFLQPIMTNEHEQSIFSFQSEIIKQNPLELLSIGEYFKPRYDSYHRSFSRFVTAFITKFPHLIPAVGLRFYTHLDESLFENQGVTTVAFEDIKDFYIDGYELVADLLDIVVAYDNSLHRGHFTKMPDTTRLTFDKFVDASKGKKIEFVSDNETSRHLILDCLDNQVRNAIGHNTYKYDGFSQRITFYQHADESQEPVRQLHLAQFAKKCVDLAQTVINLWELVYQTEKHYYVKMGYTPIDPQVFFDTPTKKHKNRDERKTKRKMQNASRKRH